MHMAVIAHEFGHALMCILREVPVAAISVVDEDAWCQHAEAADPAINLEIVVAGVAFHGAWMGGLTPEPFAHGAESDQARARALAVTLGHTTPEERDARVRETLLRVYRFFLVNMGELRPLVPDVVMALAEDGQISGRTLYRAIAEARGRFRALDLLA